MHKKALWFGLLLCLLGGIMPTLAQGQVRVVTNRDFVNIRLYPALGATVVGSANAGTAFVANGRSPDNEWLRIDFFGGEAWVGSVVVTVLEGNIDQLPIRDPRSIPYGGNESPRAGFTDQTSEIIARLPTTGVRVRSGPSTAYRILGEAPRFTVFPLLGRTADNRWVQVNVDGILGWVSSEFIEIQDNRSILDVPVDGIVASSPALNFEGEVQLYASLRYMRERLDISQSALDTQRQVWTEAALGVAPRCGGYPARPTAFNGLPREILAQYNATLDPLINDFNEAMTNVRDSIDLHIEVCGRQGSQVALTSVPVVTGGLEMVSTADSLFASLRRRIDELLPEIGPDDCIFVFGGRVDVLPLYNYSATEAIVIEDTFEPDERFSIGFCIDSDPVRIGRLELIRFDANYETIVAISPLDNPTNFIATGRVGPTDGESSIVIQPINFPAEGRYLVLVNIEPPDGELPEGDYALALLDVSAGFPTSPLLDYDADGNLVVSSVTEISEGEIVYTTGETSQIATNVSGETIDVYSDQDIASGVVGTIAPGSSVEVIATATDWVQVRLSSSVEGWVPSSKVSVSTQATNACPGTTLTCEELFDCGEVQACVDAGSTVLDPNSNGVACDSGESTLSCTVSSSSTTSTTSSVTCDCSSNNLDCSDFSTQSSAQSCYDTCFATVGDIYQLDSDNDSLACEDLS